MEATTWQSPPAYTAKLADFPEEIGDWLLDSSSMTARMQRNCQTVTVEVVNHSSSYPDADEAKQLSLDSESMALVREVYMLCDGKRWLYGRTVIPEQTLVGKAKQLIELGEVPLGKFLFSDPEITRSPFIVTQLESHHDLFKKALSSDMAEDSLWARRSKFFIDNRPLLLTEVFLPEMVESICNNN